LRYYTFFLILAFFSIIAYSIPVSADVGWCESNKQYYDEQGKEEFLQANDFSIDARICASLYEDPMWEYQGDDRTAKLNQRSLHYLEIEMQANPDTVKEDSPPTEIPDTQPSQPKTPEGSTQEPLEQTIQPEGGGCLIATAAFGSEFAPQVQMLREIRDNTVLNTASGTSFMTAFNLFYYSFSPIIADMERENEAFKETVKFAITPLLTSLSLLNHVDIDSEEEMLFYGIGIILLNIGMYFAAPAFVLNQIRKTKFTSKIFTN